MHACVHGSCFEVAASFWKRGSGRRAAAGMHLWVTSWRRVCLHVDKLFACRPPPFCRAQPGVLWPTRVEGREALVCLIPVSRAFYGLQTGQGACARVPGCLGA